MVDAAAARVGVVVRTKNRPWFLRRALVDITSQDFTDWAIHIVNDGGDRAAVEAVLSELSASTEGKLTVTHNTEPHGRSAAANEGIVRSESEFVVLHDDDDLWDRTFLSSTVSWLDAHPGDIGVMSRTEIVYEVERDGGYAEVDRAGFWPQLSEITYSDLLQVNRAVPIAFLYRRSIHEQVGLYREDLHAVEDWDFYLRITLRHHIGLIVGRPLAFWMQRVSARGDEGNSVFALAGEHERYDRQVRDEALRAYVQEFGPGLPLYLTKFIQDEVARQLSEHRGVSALVLHRARQWRHRRRAK